MTKQQTAELILFLAGNIESPTTNICTLQGSTSGETKRTFGEVVVGWMVTVIGDVLKNLEYRYNYNLQPAVFWQAEAQSSTVLLPTSLGKPADCQPSPRHSPDPSLV